VTTSPDVVFVERIQPYSVGSMPLTSVCRLRDDTERIKSIQKTTLETADYGLVPEPALLGSSDW
jgi:hypothetical protein